jgi:hypothetical protein
MHDLRNRETLRDVAIIMGIALIFFIWGMFVFFAVGDKGSPQWNFGVVEDIPGGSPYSTSAPKAFVGTELRLKPGEKVEKQHVAGQERTEKQPQ